MTRLVAAVALGLMLSGCAAVSRFVETSEPQKIADAIQNIAKVAEVANRIAAEHGMIDEATSQTLAEAVERTQALGTGANVQITLVMLEQILGELPSQAVKAAEDEEGVSVADEAAVVVAGGEVNL